MADSKGSASIPWASLAVVVAFVSSTLLAPHAFDVLRPAERERALPLLDAELEVDARLWEDPFGAMRRTETERQALCDKQRALLDCQPAALGQRRDPQRFIARLAEGAPLNETMLLAVLVPGNPFVGAEETRRRTRYAVLAGLQARGYVPDNAERLGLLAFNFNATREFDVPYETLSARVALATPGDPQQVAPYVHVVVLWIDEAALPAPKLDALARVLGTLAPRVEPNAPMLSLIGPSTSDGLRLALAELDQVARRCERSAARPCDGMDPSAYAGYRQLARARLFGAYATAPLLGLPGLDGHPIGELLTERLNRIDGQRSGPVAWRRTIATDDHVLDALLAELLLRVPAGQQRRVLLVAERDSLYSQVMVSKFVQAHQKYPHLTFEVSYFFRGIDGITARDNSGSGDKPALAKPGSGAGVTAIEWPESRDQLDYLRRYADAIESSESGRYATPIGAIGIIGNDVHDKLLVLQALHERFADKVFFTTDMDARFLHPRALPFTRNLVVASSLPLSVPATTLAGGTPPLRDSYQTAAYIATELAACRASECATVDALAKALVDHPSVYEIGRSRAVPVAGWEHSYASSWENNSRLYLAAPMLAALAFALLVWPSTPALRDVRRALFSGSTGLFAEHALQWPMVCMVATHAMVLTYAAALAVEFVEPGRWSLLLIQYLVVAVGVGAMALLFGTLRVAGMPAALRLHSTVARWGRPLVLVLVALLLLAVAIALGMDSRRGGPCLDCEPVALLQGVSAWPSQLVFVLAMVVSVVAVDQAWNVALNSVAADEHWLGMAVPDPPRLAWRWGTLVHDLLHWSRNAMLAWWPARREGPVRMARLWRQYVRRGRPMARVVRTLFWYAVTMALVLFAFWLASDGYVLEVPVRGDAQRRLAAGSFYVIALLLLPLLTVAVADSTMLASRFVLLLGRERSIYPHAVLERFAAAQGGASAALWRAPIVADPAERASNAPPPPHGAHSLLDDWIDIQIVARRTEVIAPLIVWPLVVVALLLVARSRLFDNWAFTLPVALAGAGYLLWLMALAALLKYAAERARGRALARMNADLQWLAGAGPEHAKLVDAMKRMVAAIEGERRGAFAGLLEQPLFKGLMVPLGGAGASQLVDYLLLAR